VFNTTLYNISVLVVEKTGLSGENHRPVASHFEIRTHNLRDDRH